MEARELRMRNGQIVKAFRFMADPELNVWIPCMANDMAVMERDV